MKKVDEKEFKEIIAKGVTLADFFADWCGPCRMLAPVLEEISEEVEDVNFVKVNVDDNNELAKEYDIHSIPTLIIFKDGVVKETILGYQTKENLIEFINKNK